MYDSIGYPTEVIRTIADDLLERLEQTQVWLLSTESEIGMQIRRWLRYCTINQCNDYMRVHAVELISTMDDASQAEYQLCRSFFSSFPEDRIAFQWLRTPDKKRRIITVRLSMKDGRRKTVYETAEELGVTADCVLSVVSRFINDICHSSPEKRRRLVDYLE